MSESRKKNRLGLGLSLLPLEERHSHSSKASISAEDKAKSANTGTSLPASIATNTISSCTHNYGMNLCLYDPYLCINMAHFTLNLTLNEGPNLHDCDHWVRTQGNTCESLTTGLDVFLFTYCLSLALLCTSLYHTQYPLCRKWF